MNCWYGNHKTNINVYAECLKRLQKNNIITIPAGDINRSLYFGDPIFGTIKHIYINNFENSIIEYDETHEIIIDLINKTIHTNNINNAHDELIKIQSRLQLRHGKFEHEFPEQKMSVKFLTGDESVLEIGGNIGRNTLVISSILKDDTKLVSIECDIDNYNKLNENKILNGKRFHTELCALSKNKLIQKDWDTLPSDVLLDGYKWVNTITLQDFREKYKIQFDTLVLDCEGAFYYILLDFPEILENINLIIMENDYKDITHKNYINAELNKRNFYVAYIESGGWGPCKSCFYEVWKR